VLWARVEVAASTANITPGNAGGYRLTFDSEGAGPPYRLKESSAQSASALVLSWESVRPPGFLGFASNVPPHLEELAQAFKLKLKRRRGCVSLLVTARRMGSRNRVVSRRPLGGTLC